MNPDYLDFEQPIAELEYKLTELRQFGEQSEMDLSDEISRLEAKSKSLTKSIFEDLDDWQIAQMARHPRRPYTKDYIKHIFTDFYELHGDRHYADDAAIVGGMARLNNRSVMIIGHEKGRDTKSKVKRNFGMPRPEGYRKALRLMKLAERFNIPVITFIDTPGAYPGIGAEERGQSEAIARNLYEMAILKIPTIACVIGEGGSGGALAIGVADKVMMLQYSMYSVISPEGCASILWRDAAMAADAAQAMQVTSTHLQKLKLIDEVIEEPLGGAHRALDEMSAKLKQIFLETLKSLDAMSIEERISTRIEKIRDYGTFEEE
ncbi:acetyl-CoA carboxylase carboxyltransferase subunit alpha [Suttonella ornithocola]|uniref:Acetyl-coenzyme A carboxylase carboxyl transferase subunit alpha n=1 Tax=Suttonella ornithocola TaxID=279832 RepID=A0A380MRY1_9GAMM|nr:acetyl-CoA carboxylase carboxyltransferase subunit alpha [Suttonella ornithocola]SUO95350.1 Acetyl-coenzyme A carboxylase carboxyl transferase subunit alpha [Suttonella ornithocola]